MKKVIIETIAATIGFFLVTLFLERNNIKWLEIIISTVFFGLVFFGLSVIIEKKIKEKKNKKEENIKKGQY